MGLAPLLASSRGHLALLLLVLLLLGGRPEGEGPQRPIGLLLLLLGLRALVALGPDIELHGQIF